MSDHHLMAAPACLFLGNAEQPDLTRVADKLSSDVISNYERAIAGGLSPRDAMAVILLWASVETTRLDPFSFGCQSVAG
jgi:hypothetical protein